MKPSIAMFNIQKTQIQLTVSDDTYAVKALVDLVDNKVTIEPPEDHVFMFASSDPKRAARIGKLIEEAAKHAQDIINQDV